jgi:hypothetical protein
MKLYSATILLASLFTHVSYGFLDQFRTIRHNILSPISIKSLSDDIHIFEEPNVSRKDTECLLFFTGGNSIISHEIYSNFITALTAKKLSVYTIPFQYKDFDKLIDSLKNEYADIIPMSHSSGSLALIDNIADESSITSAILLDPIDARLDRSKKIRLKHLKSLMIVRAEKAYDGVNLPFIPGFLELNEDKLKTSKDCKIKLLESEEHGHCDLLNPIYSNFIYKHFQKICDGTTNRNHEHLYNYIEWLTTEISDFVKNREQKGGCNDGCDAFEG